MIFQQFFLSDFLVISKKKKTLNDDMKLQIRKEPRKKYQSIAVRHLTMTIFLPLRYFFFFFRKKILNL